MSMERSSAGFIVLGDHDFAARQAELQQDFAIRHPGLTDIPLTGRLPGETFRLDPSLEGKVRIEPIEIGGRNFKTSFTEIVGKFTITDDLTLERTREILEKVRKGSVQINADSILLLSQLVERQINISGCALDMLKSPDFTTLPQTEQVELGIGPVEALVSNPKDRYATTEEIWAARDEKGLEPAPAETALHYLLLLVFVQILC